MAPLLATDQAGDREVPPTGLVAAVVAFVEDTGLEDYQGDKNFKQRFVMCVELAHKMADGRSFMLSNTYTLSLNEKANLRRDLEGLLGRPLTDEEVSNGYDVESLKGTQMTVNVIHKVKDGKTSARIGSIAPAMDGAEPLTVENAEPPPWIAERRQENAGNAPPF